MGKEISTIVGWESPCDCHKYGKKGERLKNAGERAIEVGYPVGIIGCPHCGITSIGAICEKCGMCGKSYWAE